MTDTPTTIAARAARTRATPTRLPNRDLTSTTVSNYLIGPQDMQTIYLSKDPYGRTFKEPLNLQKCDLTKHPTAGLQFITKDGRLILTSMDRGTPGAQIDKWRSRICGAWLVSIGDNPISTIKEAHSTFQELSDAGAPSCVLTFTHPEISPDISHNGLPIISRNDFTQLTHD
jgi:hypothetical protein